jgi:hypothetical protein
MLAQMSSVCLMHTKTALHSSPARIPNPFVRVASMRTLSLSLIFIIIGVFAPTPSFAQSDEAIRLLPDSFINSLQIFWSQDGRVVNVTIINPQNKWVVRSVILFAQFAPDTSSKYLLNSTSTKRSRAASSPYLESLTQWLENTDSFGEQLLIQPGNSTTFHLELAVNKKVIQLKIQEAKGREQTRMERIRSSLFKTN